MKKLIYILLFGFFALGACRKDKKTNSGIPNNKERQDSIVQKYLVDSEKRYGYRSPYWQYYIDKGLAKDSTIAYLWQQKAMPLFKSRKYELGMQYLDKAVFYDKSGYLGYRAFIKCIFAKTYKEALRDLDACMAMEGNIHVMDHTYRFYQALCYLQLNEFGKAEELLKLELDEMTEKWGQDGVHHLELLYYGIVHYEQKEYEEAIRIFDRVLKIYPQFSEAIYYKAVSYAYSDQYNLVEPLLKQAAAYYDAGYTINEDNAIYEWYPYQLKSSSEIY